MGGLAQDNKELVKTIIENKSKIEELKKMFQGNKEVTEKLKNLKLEIDDGIISNKNYFKTKIQKNEREENYISNLKHSEEQGLKDKKDDVKFFESDKFSENREMNSNQVIYKKSFPTNKKI